MSDSAAAGADFAPVWAGGFGPGVADATGFGGTALLGAGGGAVGVVGAGAAGTVISRGDDDTLRCICSASMRRAGGRDGTTSSGVDAGDGRLATGRVACRALTLACARSSLRRFSAASPLATAASARLAALSAFAARRSF